VTLGRAQIVNGLQTVKSINNAVLEKLVTLEDLEAQCHVQIKVIKTNDARFINTVVQATNNQNPMSPRNLKSNDREQKTLRKAFADLSPRWFYQVKDGEWESLNEDGGRFFKAVTGFVPSDFKTTKKRGRIIDNQEAAKAWLSFTGFSAIAQDRTAHYFSEQEIYEMAFRRRPTTTLWKEFAKSVEFPKSRSDELEIVQGTAYQYLTAYFIWQFVKTYVPGPQDYRADALAEGVKAGKITKASGEITSTVHQQEEFLAGNHTYQTWRLMANMKEVLAESVAWILAKRYGALDDATCRRIFALPETKEFLDTGDVREMASTARGLSEVASDQLFSRILAMLRWCAGQFWEDKRNQILSTSRIRTLLSRADMISGFKEKILEVNERKTLDKGWKPAGLTFLESLSDLP
jgi:hypothetical protein